MQENSGSKKINNESNVPIFFPQEKRIVYMDHAATTPVRDEVLQAMIPYFSEQFGNASALYTHGRKAKEALARARKSVADVLGCSTGEILFTGSGTESDNMALFGLMRKYAQFGNGLVCSTIEHHAVLHACDQLAKEGCEVAHVSVDHEGLVDMRKLEDAIKENTILVSIMYANNEIGTVQDIREIARIIRAKKKQWERGVNDPPFFHTDACQATGYLDMNVARLGVDAMTINASKMYGPKGVGVLFLRRGLRLQPIVFGGGQENKLRSGTENVPAIVGMARAIEIAEREREKESARLIDLRDYMIQKIFERIPKCVLNGHPTKRLPNNINMSFLDIEGEAILLYCDEYGLSASTGSACDSQTLDPSHVILALGRPYEFAHGSMRFTLGKSTTREDVDYAISVLEPVCALLRKASPINVDMDSYDAGKISAPQAFIGEQQPHFLKKNN